METMTITIFDDLESIWRIAREIDLTARGITTDLCKSRIMGFNAKKNNAEILQMLEKARTLATKLEPLSLLELVPFEELPD
jgi:hypothetical protein